MFHTPRCTLISFARSCSWVSVFLFFFVSSRFLVLCCNRALHIAVLAPNWSTFHIFNLYVIGQIVAATRRDSTRVWAAFSLVVAAFVCAHTKLYAAIVAVVAVVAAPSCCMPTLQTNRLSFPSVCLSLWQHLARDWKLQTKWSDFSQCCDALDQLFLLLAAATVAAGKCCSHSLLALRYFIRFGIVLIWLRKSAKISRRVARLRERKLEVILRHSCLFVFGIKNKFTN